jgi:peptide subunit release factor 1 (eRF1)
MIRKSEIEALMTREAKAGSRVLSVFLHVEPAEATNINHAFIVQFKNAIRPIEQSVSAQGDKNLQRELALDSERVQRFINDYEAHARSLAIFCDASDDLFWARPINVPLRVGARWEETPYVRPLLELFDEYERYGVILTDSERARLFTVFLGEIEEQREAFNELEVRHIKTTGTDHSRSQMNIQRKADEHAKHHLKVVAEMMDDLSRRYEFDRLILAGPIEVTSELTDLLPKHLQTRVVAAIALPIEASASDVLRETLRIEEDVERRREMQTVEDLIAAAHKNAQAVLGLEPTLRALQEGRILRLVYSNALRVDGARCEKCGALFASLREGCDYCGAKLRAVDDLIEEMVARVSDQGARVELVNGEASDRLQAEGGIGAFLRY